MYYAFIVLSVVMFGGMVLPFLQGILFYGEKITVAKAVCFLFITVALVLTVEKGERKKCDLLCMRICP